MMLPATEVGALAPSPRHSAHEDGSTIPSRGDEVKGVGVGLLESEGLDGMLHPKSKAFIPAPKVEDSC